MPKIKPHLIKSTRFMFRMTPSEYDTLKTYCDSRNKAVTDLFREALSEYCDNHNIDLKNANKEPVNPNQLVIE